MSTAALALLRPHPSPLLRPPPRRSASRRLSAGICCSSVVPASQRLVSGLSYSLPFFNSLHYGRFLFARFPPFAAAFAPILPLASAYRSLPYASFVAFFALYLGIIRNPNFPRYVRFNAMQALVLDVLLALPMLFQRILGAPSSSTIALQALEVAYGTMFLFSLGCFIYGLVSCVLGRTPHLPIVATAADRQL